MSETTISIRIASKPFNTTIIRVYAPTTDYEDQVVDEFYEDLEKLIKGMHKKDILIVMGDWNAQIGEGEIHPAAGNFGHAMTNERGLKLLKFAERRNMVAANTLHRQKVSRRVTWHSPDGVTHKQIDYILVPKQFKSSVNTTRKKTTSEAIMILL